MSNTYADLNHLVSDALFKEEMDKLATAVALPAQNPMFFQATGKVAATPAATVFTFDRSGADFIAALTAADNRKKGLCGLFYAETTNVLMPTMVSKYLVPAVVSVSVVSGAMYSLGITFGAHGSYLSASISNTTTPITVTVPLNILNAEFLSATTDILVRTTEQTLTDAQKTQVKTNLGIFEDKIRHGAAIKPSAAISSKGICGMKSDLSGYVLIGAGSVIDISYPLVWNDTSTIVISANSNYYEVMPGCTLTNNKAGISLEANKMIYLVGSLSGCAFTVGSDVFAVVPGEADANTYIPVGLSSSATEVCFNNGGYPRIYGFKDGAFCPL